MHIIHQSNFDMNDPKLFPPLFMVENQTPFGTLYNSVTDLDMKAGIGKVSNNEDENKGTLFEDLEQAKKIAEKSHAQIVKLNPQIAEDVMTIVKENKFHRDGNIYCKIAYAIGNGADSIMEEAEEVLHGVWGDPDKEDRKSLENRRGEIKEKATRQQRRMAERAAKKDAAKRAKKRKEEMADMSPSERALDGLNRHTDALETLSQKAFKCCTTATEILEKQGMAYSLSQKLKDSAENEDRKLTLGMSEECEAINAKIRPLVAELFDKIKALSIERIESCRKEDDNSLKEMSIDMMDKVDEINELLSDNMQVIIRYKPLIEEKKLS